MIHISSKQRLITSLFFVAVFLLFCIFFINMHPLFPYDCDDWRFMSYNRIAMPSIHQWNPGKVFPELMFAYVSNLAAYTIYPLCGDYFKAQTLVHGIVVSLFISVYFYAFYRLLVKRFSVERYQGMILTMLFLLLHFLIMRVDEQSNAHLFYTSDLCCYYHYIIPNVLNATLVLSLLEHDWLKSPQMSLTKGSFLLVVVYLAVFSNLYCSSILVIFLGCQLLICIRGEQSCLDYAKKNWLKIVIILLFFSFAAIEAVGQRSGMAATEAKGASLGAQLIKAVENLQQIQINSVFLLLLVLCAGYGVWYCIRKKRLAPVTLTLMVTMVVTLLYIVLLSAKVNPAYVLRPDILFSVCFPLMLLMMHAFVVLCREQKKAAIFLPLLVLFVFSRTNTRLSTFKDLGAEYGDIEVLQRINKNIFQQVIDASHLQKGDSITFVVPDANNTELNNWPFYVSTMTTVSRTLEKHGVIPQHLSQDATIGKPIVEY